MKKPSIPPSRSIFSSSVIRLRMDATRCSTAAEEGGDGASDWARAQKPLESRKICTVIKKHFRMSYPHFSPLCRRNAETSRGLSVVFHTWVNPTQEPVENW